MLQKKLEKILEYGIYLWVFLLPWQIRYFYEAKLKGGVWEAGSVSIYISEILLILLLVINFILWIKNKNNFNYKSIDFFSPIFWLVVFVLLAFFSVQWSVFPALSIYYAVKLFLALGVFWLVKTNQISFIKLGIIFISAGLMQGLLSIGQFLNQFVTGSKWLGMATQDPQNLGVSVVDTGLRRWLRAYGSFPHPNILGGFLVIVLVWAIDLLQRAEVLWSQTKAKQIQIFEMTLLFGIIIIISGIVLSFSRAAWLATIFLFLVMLGQLVFKKSFINWKTYILVLILAIFTAGLWVGIYSEPFFTRVKASERLEVLSYSQRIDSFIDAWQTFEQKPILGTGLGVYTYSLQQQHPERYVWQLQPPHNTFLLILVELGIIGLALLLFVFLLQVINFLSPKSWLFFLIASFLFLFDHWWWSLNFGIYLFFLILGIITVAKSVRE